MGSLKSRIDDRKMCMNSDPVLNQIRKEKHLEKIVAKSPIFNKRKWEKIADICNIFK